MEGLPRPAVGRVAAAGARVVIVTLACVAYSLAAQVRPSSIPDTGARTGAASARVLGSSLERAAIDPTTSAPADAEATTPVPAPSSVPAPSIAVPPGTVPPAPATTIAPAAPAPPPTDLELLRTRVLANVEFPWETRLAGWRIEFHPPRDGFRGSTRPRERVIRIYERRGSSFEEYLHVTLHEIGHAVDVTLLDTADHQRWSRTRGRPAGADWWVASGADDFGSGAGDWAESFAWWQGARDDFHSTVAPAPDDRQMAVLADIVG